MMSAIKYYRINNKEEIHHEYQYKDGLNILQQEFDEYYNGFHFTTIKDIYKYLDYGIYLREVILPIDDPEFKMEKLHDFEYRANRIILGNKYSLLDIEVWKELNLHIEYYYEYIIDCAFKLSDVELLKNLPASQFDAYGIYILDMCKDYRNIDIYVWYKININPNVNLNILFDTYYITPKVSISTLDYLHENYSSKISFCFFDIINQNDINMLTWIKNHNYKFDLNCYFYDDLQINTLEWLYENGLGIPKFDINQLINKNRLDILKWLVSKNLKIDEKSYDIKSYTQIDILNYIYENLPYIKYNCHSTELINKNRIDILEWMKSKNLDVKYEITKETAKWIVDNT